MARPKSTRTYYHILKEMLAAHGESDECMLWPFGKTKSGYGKVSIDHRVFVVHRLAYKERYGCFPEPQGLHICDTPLCFNPKHIIAGTQKDNIQDCVKKRRRNNPHGSNHWKTRFTEEQVRSIRAEYAAYHPVHGAKALAARYGVCAGTIDSIVRRLNWRHLD